MIIGLWCFVAASTAIAAGPVSGLRPGDQVSAWEPIHVAGPHAGTSTCPVCTYLEAPIVLAFAKDVAAAEKLAKPLEEIATAHRQGKLKVMLVVVNGSEEQILKLAKDSAIRSVMLCRPDPKRKEKQLGAYKIDLSVSNTIMLTQDYTVKKLWTGAQATELADLRMAADQYLPKQ